MKRFIGFVCLLAVLLMNAVGIAEAQTMWIPSENNPDVEYMMLENGTVRARINVPAEKQELYMFPSKVDGYTVSSVWMMDMSLYTKALVLPHTVRIIEPYSLNGYFEELYLPEGLETISYCVALYSDCPLTDIVIPTTVTTIEDAAFYHTVGGTPGSMAPMPGLTVYSLGNTVAKNYAYEQGYTYVDLSEYERGDTDLNGGTDMMDAVTVLSVASGASYGSAVQRVMADATRDGTINMMDALAVYRTAAGAEA